MSAPDDRYEPLAAAIAEGAQQALYERCDDGVQTADASHLVDDAAPLQELTYPAVCVTAGRTGVPGGVCLCTTAAGARALAIRSLDPLPPEAAEEPLQDSDLQAAREWGADALAGIGAAAAGVLGQALELDEVSVRALATPDEAPGPQADAPVVLRATLSVHSEPCLVLVSLPADEVGGPADSRSAPPLAAAASAAAGGRADAPAPEPAGERAAATGIQTPARTEPGGAPEATLRELPGVDLSGALSVTRVRVWAELGQVRLPLRRAIDLPVGGVVELDCDADAPVDLYVNGLRFAHGQLVITADGEWALRVDEIDADAAAAW